MDEMLEGVNIALGILSLDRCPSFDRDLNAAVTVDEILLAIGAALGTCPPTPLETAAPTKTPTSTQASTETPSVLPTPTPNRPPILPAPAIYRTYPGHDIRLPIDAADPEGGSVACIAESLPDGAELDGRRNVFSWTPRENQLGSIYVAFTCADNGVPPQSSSGTLTFKVSPPDSCTAPNCDPTTGCEIVLPPVTQNCCTGEPSVRVAEPRAGCPEGAVLFIGRNDDGFGRLQDCDRMRIINFAQIGASARFHLEARCLNTEAPVTVHARLETASRLLFDAEQPVFLQPHQDGFAQRLFFSLPVGGPTPFFDLEGAEANLSITARDADGVQVRASLRLMLTFMAIPDLPEN